MTLVDYLRKPRNKRERKVASHARRRERERIIALLEMQLETIRDSQLTGVVVLSSAIALIKGEN